MSSSYLVGDWLKDKHNSRIYEITHINTFDWGTAYKLRNRIPNDTADIYTVAETDISEYFELNNEAKLFYANEL